MSDRERLALVGLVDSIDNLVIRSRFAREVLADPAPPEPAPESEEQPIVGNAYGTYSWRPDPAPEPEPESDEDKMKRAEACRATPGRCTCGMHVTPLDDWPCNPAPEPEKLRRMAEEWLNGPDYMTPMYYQSVSLARLLERVIRETAAAVLTAYPCSCGEAYTSRKLTAPDCFRCNALEAGADMGLKRWGLE